MANSRLGRERINSLGIAHESKPFPKTSVTTKKPVALVKCNQGVCLQYLQVLLGCKNGGLDWAKVKPLIESAFAELPEVKVIVFEATGAPEVDKIQVATSKPNMTRSRSLLIRLLELYGIPGYRLTMLEVQKLAYFLQVAGEPLKLRYDKHKYGPYADNLNHALQRIEGHYIRGYGDRSREAEIYVLPEGREAAHTFLETEPDAKERLELFCNLITGFETPYGMEMLATVHSCWPRES